VLAQVFLIWRSFTRLHGGAVLEVGWRTLLAYQTNQLLLVLLGLCLLILHGTNVSRGAGGVFSPMGAFFGAGALFSGLLMLFGGSRWIFFQAARLFEFDRDRMREDGAKLAAMVAKAQSGLTTEINDILL
jgi:hypothetical protein